MMLRGAALLALAAGCAAAAPALRPAVLADAAPACRAEIAAAVRTVTGKTATLPETMFSRDSTLLLGRQTPRDDTGMQRDGMVTDMPLVLTLRHADGACTLSVGATAVPLRACACADAR